MKIVLFINSLFVLLLFSSCESSSEPLYPKNAIQFSQDYLLALKTDKPYQAFKDTLALIDTAKLVEELNSEEKKLAFWINTYNALVQQKIKEDSSTYRDPSVFFKEQHLEIGGTLISLDDIENGILRGEKVENNEDFISPFRLEKIEPRIHFALNCGATSCPPIAFYSDKELDAQLSLAEASFVQSSSVFTPETNTLEISEIFKWFDDDFGGKEGVIALMIRLKIIKSNVSPKIVYAPYDWSLTLGNW